MTFRTCHWQIKHLVAAAIVLKGVGGLLFIFGSSLGAFLLVCSLSLSTLFSWPVHGDQHWPLNNVFLRYVSLQLLHQAVASPILYDFYNYDAEKKEFNQLFLKFTQVSKSKFLALSYF